MCVCVCVCDVPCIYAYIYIYIYMYIYTIIYIYIYIYLFINLFIYFIFVFIYLFIYILVFWNDFSYVQKINLSTRSLRREWIFFFPSFNTFLFFSFSLFFFPPTTYVFRKKVIETSRDAFSDSYVESNLATQSQRRWEDVGSRIQRFEF